jgi:hypothetical protein
VNSEKLSQGVDSPIEYSRDVVPELDEKIIVLLYLDTDHFCLFENRGTSFYERQK